METTTKFLNEVSSTGTGASKKVVQRCADPQDDMHRALPDIAQLALTEDEDPVAANDDVPAPERPTQTSEEDDEAKDETASTTSSTTLRPVAHAVDESGLTFQNHQREFNVWANHMNCKVLDSQKDVTNRAENILRESNGTLNESQAKYNAMMGDALAGQKEMMQMMTKAVCEKLSK